MFKVEMLPAEFGDAIWIEYGPRGALSRVLIDCGTPSVFGAVRARIEQLPAHKRHFELLVVTHVDADHIGGTLGLLRASEDLGVTFGEIWFNGYVHLTRGGVVPQPDHDDILGPVQGETLTELIVGAGAGLWNKSTGGGAFVVPDEGPLPSFMLPGGMQLTLLSPTQAQLDRLKPVWEAACRKANIAPGAVTDQMLKDLEEDEESDEKDDILGPPDPETLAAVRFKSDTAKPNGSSIALLAEYDGRTIVLGADAYAGVLVHSLERMSDQGVALKVDAFKVSHHGSRGNTSLELVKRVRCKHWLVSSNGKQFKHPDLESIARIIHGSADGVSLHFNYLTDLNRMWQAPALQRRHGFQAHYPADADQGIVLSL